MFSFGIFSFRILEWSWLLKIWLPHFPGGVIISGTLSPPGFLRGIIKTQIAVINFTIVVCFSLKIAAHSTPRRPCCFVGQKPVFHLRFCRTLLFFVIFHSTGFSYSLAFWAAFNWPSLGWLLPNSTAWIQSLWAFGAGLGISKVEQNPRSQHLTRLWVAKQKSLSSVAGKWTSPASSSGLAPGREGLWCPLNHQTERGRE